VVYRFFSASRPVDRECFFPLEGFALFILFGALFKNCFGDHAALALFFQPWIFFGWFMFFKLPK